MNLLFALACSTVVLAPFLTSLFVLNSKSLNLKKAVFFTSSASLLSSLLLWQQNFEEFTLWSVTQNITLSFSQDRVGSLFLVLIQIVFMGALWFSFEYHNQDERLHRALGFSLLTQAALSAMCLSANLITMYLFYELVTLASFPLVLHNGTKSAKEASFIYLGYSIAGAALVLGGFILGGPGLLQEFTLQGYQGAPNANLTLAWLLMALGFSCKAGMFPLQSWLPIAHPEAPAPASALLSGIITKAGILGLIRVTYYLVGPALLLHSKERNIMLVLSLITIFLGSTLAFKEKLFKRRLAYSSVSQLSYIIFGLMIMTPMAFTGALLQVWAHAFAKVTLFLVSGAIYKYTGYTQVSELLHMGKRYPFVMAAFVAASLSLIGLPPMAGFVAKWNLAEGALAVEGGRLGGIGVAVLLISALFTAAYLLPIISDAFFSGQPTHRFSGARPTKVMYLPLLSLAAFLLLIGLYPGFITEPALSLSALLF